MPNAPEAPADGQPQCVPSAFAGIEPPAIAVTWIRIGYAGPEYPPATRMVGHSGDAPETVGGSVPQYDCTVPSAADASLPQEGDKIGGVPWTI